MTIFLPIKPVNSARSLPNLEAWVRIVVKNKTKEAAQHIMAAGSVIAEGPGKRVSYCSAFKDLHSAR